MPDRSQYNTRLRTNSLILPPRRLRRSPTPPHHHLRHPRQLKNKLPSIISPPPVFPPPNVVLHPEDAASKTCIAIGRAMLAVDNRAITIKDLSQLSLDCGLVCQNASAASQAITTFIRNHLSRCHQQHTKPLLLSLSLTGTPDDDRLAPALHSRSGGTSQIKDQERYVTSFRRGTTVWYLSEHAGAPCPFKRAGLCLDDLLRSCHGTKRKRKSPHAPPRKLPSTCSTILTRNRTQQSAGARLRVKLTLHVPETSLNDADVSASDSDPFVSDSDSLSPISDSDSDAASLSEPVSPSLSRPPSPLPYPTLPPYPILSPSIPSPACVTPTTTLASPSAPSASFPFLPFALSNPPRDFRSRSSSLPFSCASPPPDSEDEDHDFHNSMVGLRRGSLPLPKKEDQNPDPSPVWSTTPLELLPGFELPSLVKVEPISAVLPPSPTLNPWDRWNSNDEDDARAKREHPSDDERTVLDPEEDESWSVKGTGTQDDPVRIDDVEVLGPETVRSREWDVAWEGQVDMEMGVDEDCEMKDEEEECERASPAETTETAVSSPPSSTEEFACIPLHLERDGLPLDSSVVATVIDGIPVYHTLLAPNLPFLRRIDAPLVTLSPLLTFLGLPPMHALTWAPLAVARALVGKAGMKSAVLEVILQPDLGVGSLEVGIRAEDVIPTRVGGDGVSAGDDEVVVGPGTSEVFVEVGSVLSLIPPGVTVVDEQDQDDALFRSFVDFQLEESSATAREHMVVVDSLSSSPPNGMQYQASPTKLADSLPGQTAHPSKCMDVASAKAQVSPSHGQTKENAGKENTAANTRVVVRRKREKSEGQMQVQVRRSKRLSSGGGNNGTMTRAKSKAREGRA